MRFDHIGQAGLELPTSGDLSTLASQSAGIRDVSHCTRPLFTFLIASFEAQKLLILVKSNLSIFVVVVVVFAFVSYIRYYWLGAVAHTCNPSTLGG